MNRAACLLLAVALGGLPLRADDTLPQPAAADRYARMAARSPFAPPTPVAGVVAPAAPVAGPKWSDQLTVTLLMQQGGVYFATIADKANSTHFLLQSDQEDTERQLAVASVQWSDVPGQSTVTLRHNNEFAPVRFEPAGAAPAAPVASMAAPGRAPGPGGFQPPNRLGAQLPRPLNPPGPPSTANIINRTAPIRTIPTVAAPAPRPPNVAPRPLPGRNDDDDE